VHGQTQSVIENKLPFVPLNKTPASLSLLFLWCVVHKYISSAGLLIAQSLLFTISIVRTCLELILFGSAMRGNLEIRVHIKNCAIVENILFPLEFAVLNK